MQRLTMSALVCKCSLFLCSSVE